MNFPTHTVRPQRFLRLLIILAATFSLFAIPAFALGGVTWDELFDFEGVNGAFWHGINTIKGLRPDVSTITFDLEYFGNATRWPTYLIWRFLNTTPWESFAGVSRNASILSGSYIGLNHLNAYIFGFIGIALSSLIGLRFGGVRLASLTGIMLLLLPTWLGHSWMNSKDIPFATSYLIYTYGSILLLTSKSSQSVSLLDLPFFLRVIGVAFLLGSRIGSLPFILISESVYLLLLQRSYLRPFLSVLLGSFLGFLLTPQAWSHPIGYPIDAIRFISDRQGSPSPIHTFLYIISNLVETLPLLVVIGLLLLAYFLVSRKIRCQYPRVWLPVVLQLVIAPTLLTLSSKSIYNELRHILFIYPPICILSSLGWTTLLTQEKHRSPKARLILLVGLFLSITLLIENILLAPYQYVYRSDLARILHPGQFIHRDYWGFSLREAVVTCLKDPHCLLLSRKFPLYSSKSDINPDLTAAYSELIQARSPSVNSSDPPDKALVVTTYPNSLEHCRHSMYVNRRTLLPTPRYNPISEIALCENG